MKENVTTEKEGIIEIVFSNLTEHLGTIDHWMLLAILEFAIILFLLFKRNHKARNSQKREFKEEGRKQEIDFGNIIDSSFNAKALYDELKVKCHPDRFPTDPELNSIADHLFQEISKNKNNKKMLEILKVQAQQKLNINF